MPWHELAGARGFAEQVGRPQQNVGADLALDHVQKQRLGGQAENPLFLLVRADHLIDRHVVVPPAKHRVDLPTAGAQSVGSQESVEYVVSLLAVGSVLVFTVMELAIDQ